MLEPIEMDRRTRLDHLATLGLREDATADDVQRAYRRAVMECHPDVRPDDAAAEARFRAVNAARRALTDGSTPEGETTLATELGYCYAALRRRASRGRWVDRLAAALEAMGKPNR
jgi:hypothetical protein